MVDLRAWEEAGVAQGTEGGVRRGAEPDHAALLESKGASRVSAGAIGWDLDPEAFPVFV